MGTGCCKNEDTASKDTESIARCCASIDEAHAITIQPCIPDFVHGGCQLSQGRCCEPNQTEVLDSESIANDKPTMVNGERGPSEVANGAPCTDGCCDSDDELFEKTSPKDDCEEGCCSPASVCAEDEEEKLGNRASNTGYYLGVKDQKPVQFKEDVDAGDECDKGCCGKPEAEPALTEAALVSSVACENGCCDANVEHGSLESQKSDIESECCKEETNIPTCSARTAKKLGSVLRHRGSLLTPRSRPSTPLSKALASVTRLAQYTCCCTSNKPLPKSTRPVQVRVRTAKRCSEDLAEKGAAGDAIQRKAVMQIEGMDCPGCAPLVTNALSGISCVQSPKVNFFTSEATFMYAAGAMTAEEIAKRISTLTSFNCRVVRDVREDELVRYMSISVDQGWKRLTLPFGVSVLKGQGDSRETIEVQYSSKHQAREVLAMFSLVGGKHERTANSSSQSNAHKEFIKLTRRTAMSTVATIPVLILTWAPLLENEVAYQSASLVLATFVQAYVAYPIYQASLRALILQKTMDMDLLVVTSTTLAYVYSIVAFAFTVAGNPIGEGFFETSTLLVTLIMVGRSVSAYARRKATSALDSLDAMQAQVVNLVQPDGQVLEIDGELLHLDDVLRIYPDSIIPTDGYVVSGTSEVNESSVTGESLPVEKYADSPLIAGTLNISGAFDMKATRVVSDNTLSNISRLMREAQDSRLPVQDIADKVARLFAPVVLVVAVSVFFAWSLGGMYAENKPRTEALIAALKYMIAVMVVSCPCAIALCVPMVVVIAVSIGAKNGVLFKTIGSVQYARKTKVVMFDKTGTLTQGSLSVVTSKLYTGDAAALTLALASTSKHPIAQAVVEHLQSTLPSLTPAPVGTVTSIPGKGLQSSLRGEALMGGNCTWLFLDHNQDAQTLREQSRTMFAVTLGGRLIALFGLVDTTRPNALEMIQYLRSQSIDAFIVSGDEQSVVTALAKELGIPEDHAYGGCDPQVKAELVKSIQGSTKGGVMFVGDGTNDSLALTQADTGVSISSGTDVALGAADVVLVKPTNMARSLRSVLVLSESAFKRICGNFAWSFIYNILAVLLAGGVFTAAGLKGVVIPPELAGLGELVSVLPVVIIAWSMRFVKV